MSIRSLRLRLLAGGAVAILVALIMAWFAMTLLFERHLQRREAADLTRLALQLVASLHIDASGLPVVDAPLSDPRFESPSSGLYWQISTQAGNARSRSLWDQVLPEPRAIGDAAWRTRAAAGPFDQRLLLLERRVRLTNGEGGAIVQLAYDEASIGAARAEFGHELLLFLLGLWAALSAAAAVQVELGLKPLSKIREALKVLRFNPSERLATSDSPPEVEPLMRAINDLAEAREKDLVRARRRAADLAHGLKTPLAGLAAHSRRMREIGGPEAADGLDRAIAAATAAVEGELARSRAAAAREDAGQEWALVHSTVERVIEVIERTEMGARLVFEVNAPDDLKLPARPEDLAEIVGALMENAARFAKRRVRISAAATHGTLRLHIEDDGPGIDERRMEEALMRGRRLDESGPGHGLGLSIARDLVEAGSGTMALGRSVLGGLTVSMSWDRSDKEDHAAG